MRKYIYGNTTSEIFNYQTKRMFSYMSWSGEKHYIFSLFPTFFSFYQKNYFIVFILVENYINNQNHCEDI